MTANISARTQIDAATLTTFDIHPKGTHVRINVQDEAGSPAALVLPAECANQLMMTLPRMVEAALRNSHRNETLRLVHPIASFGIELGESDDGGTQQFIFTIDTGNGFYASFAADERMLTMLANAIFSDVVGHDLLRKQPAAH